MATINSLYARQILDSRAHPTLEVVCVLSDGSVGVSAVPSGASTGSYEALELRDKDSHHYLGLGVTQATTNVNTTIAQKLRGMDIKNVSDVDSILISIDATPNKSSLGANAILAVSQCLTKALAASRKVPIYRYIAAIAHNDKPFALPTPVLNLINGGKHGSGNLDFQEFQIIPDSTRPYSLQLEQTVNIYLQLKQLLIRKGLAYSVGDEGGFAPNLFTNTDALDLLIEAATSQSYLQNKDYFLGLDLAANSIFNSGKFTIKDKTAPLDHTEWATYIKEIATKYSLKLLEDPVPEDDWEGWSNLNSQIGATTTLVADDLIVTNESRLQQAIAQKACTALIIKPNQIGTITESINVIRLAKSAGLKIVVSHRSGETNDTFIADFAVGVGADYVKFGAPARGERVAKYNRLLAIETELVAKK